MRFATYVVVETQHKPETMEDYPMNDVHQLSGRLSAAELRLVEAALRDRLLTSGTLEEEERCLAVLEEIHQSLDEAVYA